MARTHALGGEIMDEGVVDASQVVAAVGRRRVRSSTRSGDRAREGRTHDLPLSPRSKSMCREAAHEL
ncbi:hypothetical protein [Streptomyces sp. VNUA24]|uniref:hypothetical protein n=1 Tax=Streptomyces sp. VNUA24 TaxID=3031131 RepID=UPI0023B7C27F|nr:hypothetical protein [Streptomyces sp. VNUA24]WEH20485.1 hypothetical protein PYR72_01380 [Streptomyces sp. VNUA24]